MILDNSVSQNYEVSVQGGNEKTNFNVSMAAMDDKGLMKGDEFNRYTGRINLDHNINRIVKIGASLSYAYKSNDKRNGGVYNQAQKMTTITPTLLLTHGMQLTAHLCSTRMALTSAISRAAVSSAVVICSSILSRV